VKTNLIFIIASLVITSCSVSTTKKTEEIKYQNIELSTIDTTDYLIAKSPDDPNYELGSSFAFVNRNGDTIIPIGKYYATYTDTLKTFAIVSDHKLGMIGIDKNENVLYKVFRFDNGPDYIKEGLFRVIRNGKIGFANKDGVIVIPCQFDCAFFFENGKAKVSNDCNEIKDFEHTRWESDSWYFIDKTGRRIE
jgi:hypothetical protein